MAYSGLGFHIDRRTGQPRTIDEGSDYDDSLYDPDDDLRFIDLGHFHQRRERFALANGSIDPFILVIFRTIRKFLPGLSITY